MPKVSTTFTTQLHAASCELIKVEASRVTTASTPQLIHGYPFRLRSQTCMPTVQTAVRM